MKPRKFKIHFNRVNMQRGSGKVWTVHFSDKCIQVPKVVVEGNLSTVFRPEARQPRAYFEGYGFCRVKGDTAFVTTNTE